MTKRWIFFIVLSLLAGGCATEGKRHLRKYHESRFLMWTTVQLDVCYNSEQQKELELAVAKVWERMGEISWKLNVYDEKSDVAKINRAYPAAVPVEKETYQVLKDALRYYQLTSGRFDVTVWPLIQLWRQSEQEHHLLSGEAMQRVLQILGSDKIELLPDESVRMKSPKTQIDLSSIIDGYAADVAKRILQAEGFSQFLIDTSGELYAAGKNCEGHEWRIGIRHPHKPDQMIGVIEIENQSVTTSGNYEKFYEIEGKRWSHILNPLTGYPEKGIASATVIGPNTEDSDALSTALCVLSPEKGIELINSLGEDWAAVLYLEDGEKLQEVESRNFAKYRLRGTR